MSADTQAVVDKPIVESDAISQPNAVEAFANDPVAPGMTFSQQPAASVELTDGKTTSDLKIEAFANDPVSPETPTAAPQAAIQHETHGVLGYKAPGLLSSLRFSSRYFWLGDEAVPTSDLKQYLQSDKSDAAHHTAAWSSQTGKGLLFFVKREEDKKTPAGVINLSEITDLTKGANNDFSFKLHGKEHAFQAITPVTRDGWYTSIESASQHALGLKEDMVSSGGYKETLSTLTAAAGLTVGAAGAAGAVAASSSSENGADKTTMSKSKDRSASRNKRSSIFGSILAKKDEPQEKTAEEKSVEATDAKEEANKEAEKKEEAQETAAVAAKKEEAKKEELKKEKALKEQAEKDKKVQEKKAAAAKKEQEKKDKAAKEQAEKEKKASEKKAAEEKKEQDKKEKENQKSLAKAQKEVEKKEAATESAEAKAQEKQAEEAEAEDKKKELELAGAGVGVAAVTGTGVAAATSSAEQTSSAEETSAAQPLSDKTNIESPAVPETSKTTKSTKRNSIFGFFQKSSTPTTEKTEDEAAPAVPPKDETPILPAEADKTETVQEDGDAITSAPVTGAVANGHAVNGHAVNGHAVNGTAVNGTAVNGTAVNGTAVNGHAVNGAAINGTAVNGTATTDKPAVTETSTTDKRRSSFFNLGSFLKEKETKTEPATNGKAVAPVTAAAPATPAAPATAAISTDGTNETTVPATPASTPKSKQPSKLSEFIRRPSQLIKQRQHAQKDKTNSTAPATVPEDNGVKVNDATGIDAKTEEVLETTKVEPIASEPEAAPATIGDVVPEAVSVGQTQDSLSTPTATAPVVSASA